MRDSLLRDFFLGFVRIHVLQHAAREPVYGLALIDELGRHGYRLGPGSLYPLLHGLEEAGFLNREDRIVGGRVRKYYVSTEAGAEALDEARLKIRELVDEVLEGEGPGRLPEPSEEPAAGGISPAGARWPDLAPTVRPWAIVQHVGFEGPGLIASEAARRGIELDIRIRERGDPLPRLDDVDGLILLGGPMGAGDVADEWGLTADALARGLPVLGICLGAQVMAAATGAHVCRGPAPEVGRGTVRVLVDDPVLGRQGTDLTVMHWHHDTFDTPRGAVHLAATDLYPMQAFRLGRAAYGLQFHVEVDDDLARGWRERVPVGVDVQPTWEGRRVLGRFFDHSLP